MNFTSTVSQEAAAFGYALLAGAALGLYYDVFRIIRRIFRFGYAMILAQDLFFWLSGAVGVFFGSVVVYGGQLRILFVMGVLIGWGVYAVTAGTLLMAAADCITGLFRRLFSVANKRVFSPFAGHVCALAKRCNGYFTDFLYKKTEKMVKKKKKHTSNRQIAS